MSNPERQERLARQGLVGRVRRQSIFQGARALTKLAELLVGLRASGYPPELATHVTAKMIKSAKEHVVITSGSLNPIFYADDKLLNALTQVVQRGVRVELLTGPDMSAESFRAIEHIAVQGDLRLYQSDKRPTSHFVVVDGKHCRLELPHKAGAEERRRAFLWQDVPEQAQRLETGFRQMVSGSRLLIGKVGKMSVDTKFF